VLHVACTSKNHTIIFRWLYHENDLNLINLNKFNIFDHTTAYFQNIICVYNYLYGLSSLIPVRSNGTVASIYIKISCFF